MQLQLYRKEINTGVFQWILEQFKKQFFFRRPPGDGSDFGSFLMYELTDCSFTLYHMHDKHHKAVLHKNARKYWEGVNTQ